ncbi:MAG: gluconolaconase, partial [Gammaproteobacteria bacterium]|nr:gluconolaconase [Gammaproteobacteria bacterium]
FTPDHRHALVTNATAGTLAVFDSRTRKRVATVPLAPKDAEFKETMLGKDALPIGVVADPVKSRVYVAISGADRIAVVDAASWKVMEYWKTGTEPDALGIVTAKEAQ